jgi:DNA mismatch endonuclease (patch repair protein)
MDEFWRKAPERAYKPRDPRVTSAMMSRVKNKNSKAETLLRRALWNHGHRYRLHDRTLPGKPDLVFRKARTVVFVDSDWWHGRILQEQGEEALRLHLRTARQDWWVKKISRTVSRDREVTEALEAAGWYVCRVWESEILADVDQLTQGILAVLDARH